MSSQSKIIVNLSSYVIQRYKKTLDRVYQVKESRSNQKRVNILTGMLFAMIKSGQSSLHEVGNKYPDSTDLESRIKKVKRWLDSKYSDFNTFYIPYIYLLFNAIPSTSPLVIAIDGSEIGNGCTVLMLSLIYRKRSLPICWLVRKGKKGHWSVDLHIQLLKRLKLLLITNHQIILLGDGEFDGWSIQQYCKDNNWDYVLRTAKSTQIETQHGDTFPIGMLYPMKGHDYYFVEDVYFTKNRYGTINCLVWHSDIHDDPLFLVSAYANNNAYINSTTHLLMRKRLINLWKLYDHLMSILGGAI